MTLTFENDNDVIVYALEKIISYARKNCYIFVAQSVWWIASIIGLTEGLVKHIENLRVRDEARPAASEVQPLSSGQIHPDRISQIDNADSDSCEVEDNDPESDRVASITQQVGQFVDQSRNQRLALKRKPCLLSRTRSGKIPVKPLTKKQRNRLQAIPKDTLSAYLVNRKK